MRILSRVFAFGVLGFVLSLPALGADEKEKKKDEPKKDADKTEVKKDDPAKKDEPAKKDKDEPAKKDAKKDDPAKKDAEKKDNGKKMPSPKMMPPPGKAEMKGLERDPAKAAEKLMKSTQVTAEVMAVVEEKKSLRLKLTIPYLKVNAGEIQNYQNAYLRMIQAQNAQSMAQAQLSMAQHQARIYEVASTQKEVEWQGTDDVRVRMKNPPAQFDDKGRVKKYTAKELKELKGNDKLPGYPAEFSDLKTGQIVQVTLVQKKEAPRPRRGRDADLLGDNMPTMSLILILIEPRN